MAIKKRLIIDSSLLQLTIDRLCHQLIENHDDFSNTVILGLQPRGVDFAKRIKNRLEGFLKVSIPFGCLDITFYRDDFRRRDTPLQANSTNINFSIENKRVILIDDVLFTGRTLRAALTAMNAFGRPTDIELLVLIDRLYTRQLPIEATYIGKQVTAIDTENVLVQVNEDSSTKDKVWLVSR